MTNIDFRRFFGFVLNCYQKEAFLKVTHVWSFLSSRWWVDKSGRSQTKLSRSLSTWYTPFTSNKITHNFGPIMTIHGEKKKRVFDELPLFWSRCLCPFCVKERRISIDEMQVCARLMLRQNGSCAPWLFRVILVFKWSDDVVSGNIVANNQVVWDAQAWPATSCGCAEFSNIEPCCIQSRPTTRKGCGAPRWCATKVGVILKLRSGSGSTVITVVVAAKIKS